MPHLPPELAQLFPADAALLAQLKQHDRHFGSLCTRLAALDAEILPHDAETSALGMDDLALEALKRERLAVLDALATLLAGARSAQIQAEPA